MNERSMNTMTRREMQKQERRNQLLDVARKLFAEKGVENTTVKDIADAAGVAQGLLYHYFRGKDEVFWAIIGRDNPFPIISEVLAGAHDRPACDVLVLAGMRVFAVLGERADLFRIILRECTTRPEMRQEFKVVQAIAIGLITRYLEARIEAGELRPHNPDVIARMLVGSMVAGFLLGMSAESYVPEVVETLLTGLAAESYG